MSETAYSTQSLPGRPADAAVSVEQMSAYYLELERVLDRVEHAATHYQVLGLDRSATHEQVLNSYQQSIAVLFPAYDIGQALPDQTLGRMDRGYARLSYAFTILAAFGKRVDYDNSAQSKAVIPPLDPGKLFVVKESAAAVNDERPASKPAGASPEQFVINHVPRQKEVYKEFTQAVKADNRRRSERFGVSIPARVVGHDRKAGKWSEMGKTVDVSRTGVNLHLSRRVRHGQVIYLTLPLPVKLRNHGYTESTYNVYALVRRIEPMKQGGRLIGLEFIGERPPAGFLEKPWAVFRTGKWGGGERRRKDRIERAEPVTVEYFNESLQLISREEARTENVSRSGARIIIQTPIMDFDLVRVLAFGGRFQSFAVVRNRFFAKDKTERLCVQFINKEWPLDGVPK